MNYDPELHHRHSIRLKGYDYSQAGAYFITICTSERICLFGKIEHGQMILNDVGIIAYNKWWKTTELRKNVELDAFVVMPNHIHGIIIINSSGGFNEMNANGRGVLHTPNQIQNEMGVCNTPDEKGVCNTPLRPRSPSQTIGAIVRGYKSSVTKQIKPEWGLKTLWQRNYYEHIIRNEQSYQIISEYIINNPLIWLLDKFYKQ